MTDLLQAAAEAVEEPRFFVEHGTIHDRLTGKHVTGDAVFGQSVVDESLAALNELHLALLIADEVLSCDPAYDEHYKLSKVAIRKALHGQTRDAQPEEPK